MSVLQTPRQPLRLPPQPSDRARRHPVDTPGAARHHDSGGTPSAPPPSSSRCTSRPYSQPPSHEHNPSPTNATGRCRKTGMRPPGGYHKPSASTPAKALSTPPPGTATKGDFSFCARRGNPSGALLTATAIGLASRPQRSSFTGHGSSTPATGTRGASGVQRGRAACGSPSDAPVTVTA